MMTGQPLVSIIIRTKNEERWISSCLKGITEQTYKNIEIIIVDNNSTDHTLQKASEYPYTLVRIDKFLPGKALNDGIRASLGEFIICLSAHCIPVDAHWVKHLLEPLEDTAVAGAYGRQQPLSFTSDEDKRDLITVFGLDKKIQLRDPFFHNANSALRKCTWEMFPFDETVANLEDRVWGQAVIDAGKKIIYTPDASVFHWHGIHQGRNTQRAKGVIRVIESLGHLDHDSKVLHPESMKTTAIIPIRGSSISSKNQFLLERAIKTALSAKYVSDVIVSTDDESIAEYARSQGARAPFIRPKALSESHVDVNEVFAYSIDQLEQAGEYSDLVVVLEATYPFRTSEMIDEMISKLIHEGFDTVIAGHPETRSLWLQDTVEGVITPVGEGFMPRELKTTRAIIGMMGFACVTRPVCVRTGSILKENVGIFELPDPMCSVEVRDQHSLSLVEAALVRWNPSQIEDA